MNAGYRFQKRLYLHLFLFQRSGQGLRKKKPCIGAYVITPASGGNNILDIYPAAELLLPYYREKDFLIMGIAFGYDEATEVAARIVADLYRKTGGFCLNQLLGDEAP